MKKKLLCLCMALFMILPLCVSCAQEPASKPAPTQGAPATTAAPVTDVVINNEGNFRIVYPAQSQLRESADTLANALLARSSVRATLGDDSKESDNEILIGATARTDSSALADLKLKDYRIFVDNGTLCIVGGSESAVIEAVERFTEDFVKRGEKEVVIPGDLDLLESYDYYLEVPEINGVSLRDYTVAVASEHDPFTLYAAQNLIDYVGANMGISLTLDVTDKPASPAIIVGTGSAPELADGQFSLHTEGGNILMDGKSYMIGGAVSKFIHAYLEKSESITDLPTEAQAQDFEFLPTRNALLLVGDGMGKNHISAALKDRLTAFNAHALPYSTDCTTYSESVTRGEAEFTDSAASGTAFATGHKTLNYYVGIDADANTVKNAREYAQEAGAKTAILTTDSITGATPAVFLAHVNNRENYSEIQAQIDELVKKGEVDFAEGDLGDSLLKKSSEALYAISEGDNRFFAMLEEAYVDKNSHNNLYEPMLDAMVRFDDLIAYAIEFALCHPDMALIITADHETGGLTYNAETDSYEFTRTTHSNADVAYFMLGYDAQSFTADKIDNIQIGQYLCDLYK